jgi:hypothetical protein
MAMMKNVTVLGALNLASPRKRISNHVFEALRFFDPQLATHPAGWPGAVDAILTAVGLTRSFQADILLIPSIPRNIHR